MSSHSDLRNAIDHFLAGPKELAGIASWHRGPRSGQLKWKTPLSLGGEILPMDLIVIAYPSNPTPTFMMMVTYDEGAVCRLDYGEEEEHNNGWLVPSGIPRGKIRGPHLHGWLENRGLASHSALPDPLEFAIIIPVATRGFTNSFRWFCGEHHILIQDVPEYPATDLLI